MQRKLGHQEQTEAVYKSVRGLSPLRILLHGTRTDTTDGPAGFYVRPEVLKDWHPALSFTLSFMVTDTAGPAQFTHRLTVCRYLCGLELVLDKLSKFAQSSFHIMRYVLPAL